MQTMSAEFTHFHVQINALQLNSVRILIQFRVRPLNLIQNRKHYKATQTSSAVTAQCFITGSNHIFQKVSLLLLPVHVIMSALNQISNRLYRFKAEQVTINDRYFKI